MNIGRSSGLQKMTVTGLLTPPVDMRTSAIAYVRSPFSGTVWFVGSATAGEGPDGGDYDILNDETGAAIQMALVANQWGMIPEKVGAFAGFLKINFNEDRTGDVVEFALKG